MSYENNTIVQGTVVWKTTETTDLFTLEKRWLRRDNVQVFQYLNVFSNVDYSVCFYSQTNPRTSHKSTILSEVLQSWRQQEFWFFSNQPIRQWNNLPAETGESEKIVLNFGATELSEHYPK